MADQLQAIERKLAELQEAVQHWEEHAAATDYVRRLEKRIAALEQQAQSCEGHKSDCAKHGGYRANGEHYTQDHTVPCDCGVSDKA